MTGPSPTLVVRPASAGTVAWHSYHVHPVDPDPDLFVGRYLREGIEGFTEGVRRVFFIRYWDDGLQIRVRVRTTAAIAEATVRPALDAATWAYAAETGAPPPGVYAVPYDRTAHYFGETSATVYAELLNEQTSALAILMLAGRPARSAVYLGLLGLLGALMETAFGGGARDMIQRSVAFAESAGGGRDLLPDTDLARLWPVARRSGAALSDVPAARRTAALLRRVVVNADPFGATHALHLLCNKVGVLLPAERHLFLTLLRLEDGPGRGPCTR